MSDFIEWQYYKFWILATFFLHITTTYKTISLNEYKLCTPLRTGEVRLGLDGSSAVIVTLGQLKKPTSQRDQVFKCKFEVSTLKSSGYGIFAIIQQMVFRKNDSNGDCIDYVQYQTADNCYSHKYCGRLSATLNMDSIFKSSDPEFSYSTVTPTVNSYVDASTSLTVHITLAEDYFQTSDELELEIAFTMFTYCFPVFENFKPCHAKHKERCIYKNFFYDDKVNCPYPDCVDEGGCSEAAKTEVRMAEKKSIGNKVIIGSVSLLLVIFLLFVCFVWMCRKYRKLCWAEDFAQSNTRTIELSEPPMRDVPISTGGLNVASGLPPTEEDKDLPPSYESLFPNR